MLDIHVLILVYIESTSNERVSCLSQETLDMLGIHNYVEVHDVSLILRLT